MNIDPESSPRRPRRFIGGARALRVFLAAAIGGIAATPGCAWEPRDCDFKCDMERNCADDFTCNAEGWCVRPGSRTRCSAEVGGPEGSGGTLSSGDAGNAGSGVLGIDTGGHGGSAGTGVGGSTSGGLVGNGAAGLGGSIVGSGGLGGSSDSGGAPHAGSAGEGGSGGSGGSSSCELALGKIELELPAGQTHLCATKAVTLRLSLSGAVPPIEWQLVNTPGFELDAGEGSEVTVQGTPTQTGALQLRAVAKDACGREASREFEAIDVREAPTLLPEYTLPRGCAGRLYKATLDLPEHQNAETQNLPPGLHVGAPSGVIAGIPELPGDFQFALTWSNACGSASTELRLNVSEQEFCPIHPQNEARTAPLACRNQPYNLGFVSEQPAEWQLLEPSEDQLTVSPKEDGSIALVDGTPTKSVNLIVQTKVGEEYTVAGFDLPARDSCWFGYVTDDSASTLELFDPILQAAPAHWKPRAGVADFSFSLDGRFLQYTATGERSNELTLLNLRTWEERVASFQGNVTHVAWSEAGALAVVFTNGEAGHLSGLDTTGLIWSSTDPIPIFAPVPAQVGSPLVWIGNEFVAYTSSPGTNGLSVRIARRSTSGFSTPISAGADYADPRLHATPQGLFVTDWRTGSPAPPSGVNARIDFLIPAQSAQANPVLVPHRSDEIVAPNGTLSGRAAGTAFELFVPTRDTLNQTPAPDVRVANCKKMLAWTRNSDRIACLNDPGVNGGSSELRIFDLKTPGDVGRPVPGAEGYRVEHALSARRGFSPSGKWFAYAVPASVYVADVSGPTVTGLRALRDTTNVTDFEFSPDDRVLIVHSSSQDKFRVFSLPTENARGAQIDTATTASCEEVYARAPDRWCGRTGSTAGFAWSPSAPIYAHRDEDGLLKVNDFSRWHALEYDRIIPKRGAEAFPAKAFSFQPIER